MLFAPNPLLVLDCVARIQLVPVFLVFISCVACVLSAPLPRCLFSSESFALVAVVWQGGARSAVMFIGLEGDEQTVLTWRRW